MNSSGKIPATESLRTKILLEKIKQHQPNISCDKAEYILGGSDHEVIILDNKLVYRFPKVNAPHNTLFDEAHLLTYLNQHIDGVQIPKYTYVADDGSFGSYEYIHGDPLSTETLNGLSEDDKDAAIQQIASFVSQLHATPLDIIEKYNVKESNPEETYRTLEENVTTFALHRLSKDEQETTLQYLANLRATLDHEFKSVLKHGDLKMNNVLWNAAEKQIKIIDFGDREYGDPADEFRWLMHYGQNVLDKILGQYQGSIDANLQSRIELQYIRPAFRSMWVGVERNDEQRFQSGYGIFRKYFYDD
jgi:aminoglycoside phosphotransferase (APT) family kinase protein